MLTLAMAAILVGDDGLNEAAKKFSGSANYTFKATAKSEGGKGKGGGGTADCVYDGANPLYVKTGGNEAYIKNGTMVYKGQDGKWTVLETPQKGEKMDRSKAALMAIRAIRPPHEEMGAIDSKLKDVKNEKDGESTVYTGTLTDEAAKEFGSGGRKGGKGEMTHSGSAKIWVDSTGAIVKYEIVVNTKGKMKDQEVDITNTRTVELSALGSTAKLEVPEEVTKLLP